MRQKVGKKRSQEGCAPLANPRRNGPNLTEKNPVFVCRAAPPGFRDSGYNNGYGRLCHIGSAGYSWASTISGSNVHFLFFNLSGVYPQRIDNRAFGLQLRCLQEEGGCWAPGRSLPVPVGAQPSRGEYNSFLSPAKAARAPTFCDATESRQRTQPRGLRPLGHPPRLGSESPTEKIRPCAHPFEAVQNPGWSAERHPSGTLTGKKPNKSLNRPQG